MNYKKHYNRLCERAKQRNLDCYVESHHVVPKCLGGDESNDNLVKLTPEEHYVAHQLLVKIHPDHKGLVWAALQMSGHSTHTGRANNKLYGWLRRKYQQIAKQRTGEKNGSYGRHWYYHPETLDNIKCLKGEVPEGYIKGRKIKPNTKCKTCKKDTKSIYRIYCEKHSHRRRGKATNNTCVVCGKDTKSAHKKYCDIHRKKFQNPTGRYKWQVNEEELRIFFERYTNGESLRKLASETNVSHKTLHKRFNNLDIKK
jgi:hypothetical protein